MRIKLAQPLLWLWSSTLVHFCDRTAFSHPHNRLQIPILATKRMRQAYGYIDDDRVVVTRPAAMREVQALKALRTRNSTHFLASDPAGDGRKMADIPGLETAVQKMITQGWARQKEAVTQYKKELWENNGKVVERLLGFDQP